MTIYLQANERLISARLYEYMLLKKNHISKCKLQFTLETDMRYKSLTDLLCHTKDDRTLNLDSGLHGMPGNIQKVKAELLSGKHDKDYN